MPKFEVQPCTEADMPRVFEILSLAFANEHEYVDCCWQNHDSPAGRKAGGERMLELMQDPNGHLLKVVDLDDTQNSGRAVAAAKWNIYKPGEVPPQPVMGGDWWDTEENKEFALAMFHGFFAPRQKVLEETNGNLVALEMMMVDPEYQRQGCGRRLVQWGCAKADELGVDAVVEGSAKGRGLYMKEGFDGPHHIVVVPEKFADRRKQEYYWMRRPAHWKAREWYRDGQGAMLT